MKQELNQLERIALIISIISLFTVGPWLTILICLGILSSIIIRNQEQKRYTTRMPSGTFVADKQLRVEQACKDANISLFLALLSILGSSVPILGIVTALTAERIAYLIPKIEGIDTIRTKKNIVHYLTPLTLVLSVLSSLYYYYIITGNKLF